MKICLHICFITLLSTTQIIDAVKLVVIKEDSGSKSEEDSVEKFTSNESKDIDLLMDFIEKESRGRKNPPVRTGRVVRRKRPQSEFATQHSFRNERVQVPKLAKEYHVHYHNHQHKAKENPSLIAHQDKVTPMLLDTLASHLNTFQNIYTSPRAPSMPLIIPSEVDRFKDFKDFESLLQPKNPDSELHAKYSMLDADREVIHSFDDASSQPVVHASNRTNGDVKTEILKTYQKFLNTRFRHNSQNGDEDFLNRDRFAGFTDFSNIESPLPTSEDEKPNNPEKEDDMVIKDFAIVIKTKNRSQPTKKSIQNHDHRMNYHKVSNLRPKLRMPQETRARQALRLPRILDSPGGSPAFIDRLNLLKHAKLASSNVALRHALAQNLNSIESQHQQRFSLKPMPRPNLNSHVYNGWVVQRVVR
ncbi:unnamed protein product [Larinioides sclopetarius]|uniref:Uncharacterized protein n=1 Tax=Larinioides sclopetarius TaxID=280406 RepID=A0AAV1YTH0_9ARAC